MYLDGWPWVKFVILDVRKQAWHVFKQLCENLGSLKQQQKQIDGVCGRGGRFSLSGRGAIIVYSKVGCGLEASALVLGHLSFQVSHLWLY